MVMIVVCLMNGCESSVLFLLFIDLFRAKFCMNFLKRRYLYHVLRFYQAFYITMFRQADVRFHWKLQTRLDNRGDHIKMDFEIFQLLYKNQCFLLLELKRSWKKWTYLSTFYASYPWVKLMVIWMLMLNHFLSSFYPVIISKMI